MSIKHIQRRHSPQDLFTLVYVFAPILVLFSGSSLFAQTSVSEVPNGALVSQQDQRSGSHGAPSSQSASETVTRRETGVSVTEPKASQPEADSDGKQSKRILWIVPNYRTVSANSDLPPLSFKDKLWLSTQDSFDYSSFVLAGMLAGINQAKNSTSEFHQGTAGYGRYYWHSFADQALGNYLTEAIVPAATHEDPRYYSLGQGGILRRSAYAMNRLVVTRKDSGGRTFNFSEILGNGAAAGISNLYYPTQERTWTKTQQKWVTQVAIDGMFNVFKEFWPDINRIAFRGHF